MECKGLRRVALGRLKTRFNRDIVECKDCMCCIAGGDLRLI